MSISERAASRHSGPAAQWSDFSARVAPLLGDVSELCFELYNRSRGRRSRFGALQDLLYMLRGSIAPSVMDGDWGQVQSVFILDGTGANGFGSLSTLIERYSDRAPIGLVTTYRTHELARSLARGLPGTCCIANIDRFAITALPGVLSRKSLKRILALSRDQGWGAIPYLLVDAGRREALRMLMRRGRRVRNLFVANERTHASAVALALAKGKARRICVQHGLPMAEYLPLVSDHYWAWDPIAARWLSRRALHTCINIFGSPRIRSGRIQPPPSAPSDGRLRALFAAQPLGIDFPVEGYLRLIDLVESLKSEPTIEVRCRLHPADRVSNYPDAYRQWAETALANAKRGGVEDALKQADVVLSHASTVLYEAATAGLSSIVLNPPPCPEPDRELFGLFPQASTLPGLLELIGQARSGKLALASAQQWPIASEALTETRIDAICASRFDA